MEQVDHPQFNSGSISTNYEIDALGRLVSLGTLYDARTGVFHDSISLFEQDPKINSIDIEGLGTGGIKYTLATSIVDNLNVMNVSGELKFNILTGLYEVEGSSTYFKKSKSTEKKVKGTLIYPYFTVKESVDTSSSEVQPKINELSLDYKGCTHVVVGIKWGGNAIIYIEHKNSCTESKKELEFVLESLKDQDHFDCNGKIKAIDKSKNDEDRFHIEIMGDISPKEVPTNVKETIEMMKNVPKLIKEANKGKGNPVKYILAPISNIREFKKLEILEKQKFVNIDEVVVNSCVTLFKNLFEFESKLSDLDEDKKYLRPSKVDQVNNLKQEYDEFLAQVKSEVGQNLIDVRTGTKTIDELKSLINDLNNRRISLYSWSNPIMKQIIELREEILFIKQMISNDVEILSSELPLQTYLRKGYEYSFILFYVDEFSSEPQQCMTTFLELLKERDKFISPHFALSNYDNLSGQFEEQAISKTSLYRKGQLVEENFNIQDHLIKYFREVSLIGSARAGLRLGLGTPLFPLLVLANNFSRAQPTVSFKWGDRYEIKK